MTTIQHPATLPLGKLPATHDPRTLQFEKYFTAATLPTPPAQFGHEALVTNYGMLGNDKYGCCVWAAAGHETMLWKASAGGSAVFTDANILAAYSAVTGFNVKTGANDNGTNMLDALNYRRKIGILDKNGTRHKIGAFVALKPGNFDHLLAAAWLFGAVEIGINFPASAMTQFNAGQPWDVVKGAHLEGGHDVPLVAHRGNLVVITWGQLQQMTPAFYKKYCDEAYAILSTEMICSTGKTLEGFDLPALQADFAALTA